MVAITPFNYPGAADGAQGRPRARGRNAVDPQAGAANAADRPLADAKAPRGRAAGNAIQCLTGPGSELGSVLCADPRVRKISFTGSTAVGEEISRVAGVKRLSLELGANCPLVVLPDADLEQVAAATATGGYVNAGQVCISVQRVLVAREVYDDFVERLTPLVAEIKTGHPLAEGTTMGPVISRPRPSASRANPRGRRKRRTLVAGGERDGAVVAPRSSGTSTLRWRCSGTSSSGRRSR